MELTLNNIEVDCIIGERADERARVQRLRVDVALTVDDRVAESDRLEDAVDYAVLTEKIRAALVAAKCQMIERAAKVVVDVCRADGKVRHAKATVTKFGAILHLESAAAVYEG